MKNTTVFLLLLLVVLSGVGNAESCKDQFVREGEVDIPRFEQCLTNLIIPTGAVMAFDRPDGCPSGWVDLAEVEPDLFVGRTIVSQGSAPGREARGFRDVGGTEAHTLTNEEMPAHRHDSGNVTELGPATGNGRLDIPNADMNGGPGWYGVSATSKPTTAVGGNQPHNNMPPYIALYFCKKE